jgi:DNA (cytosine-5)-methyltransferase 1
MKYISLFSGIEAATVAWHPLGWEPLFFCEIEDFPSAVLKHHYPNVPNLKDVTTINEGKINVLKSRSGGKIDLLVGGSPCQSFSVAGHRKGLEDPRGNLMYQYIRLVKAFCPKWVVWENVPGALSSGGGRDFGTLLSALAQFGYGLAYRVLDAKHFGVPQKRRRVFVVGCFGNAKSAFDVLFEQESSDRDSAESGEEGKNDSSEAQKGVGEHQKVGTLDASYFKGCGMRGGLERTIVWNKEVYPEVKHILDHQVAGTLYARDYKGISSDDINKGAQKMVVEPHNKVRRLTPKECERLQGFPDDYTQLAWNGKGREECPTSHRYKALGNSMAVPVMRWLGERIMRVEGLTIPQKVEVSKPAYKEIHCIVGNLAAGRNAWNMNQLGIKKDISYTLDGTHVPAIGEDLDEKGAAIEALLKKYKIDVPFYVDKMINHVEQVMIGWGKPLKGTAKDWIDSPLFLSKSFLRHQLDTKNIPSEELEFIVEYILTCTRDTLKGGKCLILHPTSL